jgi:hypothetical protein
VVNWWIIHRISAVHDLCICANFDHNPVAAVGLPFTLGCDPTIRRLRPPSPPEVPVNSKGRVGLKKPGFHSRNRVSRRPRQLLVVVVEGGRTDEAMKEKVLFVLLPRVVIAAMHNTMIRASITAYSTAVGPSSAFRNSTIRLVMLRMRLSEEQGEGP